MKSLLEIQLLFIENKITVLNGARPSVGIYPIGGGGRSKS